MLETGEYATADDLAAAEKINPSYLSRILRLNQLAPDIVVAILDGRQPPGLQLDPLLKPFPVEWERQRAHFRLITCRSSVQIWLLQPIIRSYINSLHKAPHGPRQRGFCLCPHCVRKTLPPAI